MAFSEKEHWTVVVKKEAARRLAEFMNEKNVRANLAAAMKRIENGTYTKCAVCGGSISIIHMMKDPLDTITCRDRCEEDYFKNLILSKHNSLSVFASSSSEVARRDFRDESSYVSVSTHEGDMIYNSRIELKVSNTATHACRKTEGLLIALENGTYRLCEDCDEKIPSSRQVNQPLTRHCTDCKEEDDAIHSTRGYDGRRRTDKHSPLPHG